MSTGRTMKILSVLEPIVDDVDRWLDGDGVEPPSFLVGLPPSIANEIEVRLMRARAELRVELAAAPGARGGGSP